MKRLPVDRAPLGQVVGAILSADFMLNNDPISEFYGVHPDARPALEQVARTHGWTIKEVLKELDRRAISGKWQYNMGLGGWES